MKPAWSYHQLRNRQLVAIPLIVSALFLASILVAGVPLGRDLKGGSLIMVQGLENISDLNSVGSAVEGLLGVNADVVFVENGLHIETDTLSENDEANIMGVLYARFGISTDSVTIDSLGPISNLQSEQVFYSLIAAFVAMGVIVFIIFRRRIVPIAILTVVGLDIICVLGYMALFRVPLGLASALGIVMLVGYAIDTNILLAWRILKRVSGEPKEQATGSINMGLMMSVLVVVTLLCLNILTSAQQLNVLTAVLIFGISINILNTWFLGVGILLGHAERQRMKGYHVSL